MPPSSPLTDLAALTRLDATDALHRLARREISALDLTRACLDRIAARDGALGAFVHVDADAALAQARALDAGPIRGLLHGLPIGVKDLFDSADAPTAYGSPAYAGHRPRTDAAALALCREAGAVMLGKTVTTELAYFQPGATRNPLALAQGRVHTPGGSSSGSAAAVADHLLPLALGTQTAGSVIRPAAFCGLVGYKPSLGRVPRAGIKSLSDTLDTPGAFGRSVADAALLGAVLTGDARLLAAAGLSESGWAAGLAGAPDDVAAPRIGLCRTPDWPHADADTRRAWDLAAQRLAPHAAAWVEPAWPADLPDLSALQLAVMTHEMARALRPDRLQHGPALSERLRTLLDAGMQISGAQHAAHLRQTLAARQRIDALFIGSGGSGGPDGVDVLLSPSTPGEAPAGLDGTGDPLFCRGWTLLGLPCIHLPFSLGHSGLPVGLQLVGRHGDDHRLIAAAHWAHARLQRGDAT